jgi:hypothetical protein
MVIALTALVPEPVVRITLNSSRLCFNIALLKNDTLLWWRPDELSAARQSLPLYDGTKLFVLLLSRLVFFDGILDMCYTFTE